MRSRGVRKLVAGAVALSAVAAAIVALSPTATAGSHGLRIYRTCPARDVRQLTSTTSGANRQLVPSGSRQVLICRYGGLDAGAARMRLVSSRRVVDQSTAAHLAKEFDALHRFRNGSYSCPADFGAKIIAIFHYLPAPKSDDPVSVDISGCMPVTNGHLIRTAMLSPGAALLGQLERLTHKRR